jgi:hypothetical protein
VQVLDASSTASISTPSPTATWATELGSPRFAVAGAGSVEACANVVWTQKMRQTAALTLRATLAGAGPESEAVATAAGVPGVNTLTLRHCARYAAPAQETRSFIIRLSLLSEGGSGAGPLGDYSVTVRWVATWVPASG